ncbi:MAG: hypothetical protein JXA82_03510 [Sedimentisphaerales bacterium]|nr:hypothetical protein [Sedimentisphaerales bacterium]
MIQKNFNRSILILLLVSSVCFAGELNVLDAGAVADGKTDCTAVFQKLLDQAGAAGGGIVYVPAGQYAVKSNLVIPGGVTLEGTFTAPPSNRHDRFPNYHGSVLLAYAGRGSKDGKPFIQLAGNMATVKGFIVHYPEWKQSDVPPVPYPPCILGRGFDNLAVIDCCLINPYEGIRFERAGRQLVRNVYGYPIWRGFYVDECYDIGRMENCHFWPFGVNYRHDDPFCEWVNVNGVAFEFARTDWHYVINTFCFGYGVGYKFSQSERGACNGNFLGIGADSCRRAVLVEQGQPPGILITNGELVGRWGSEDSVCLEIAKDANTKVSLTNCSFWGPIDKCVLLKAPGSQFTANACHFLHWDNANKGSAAIELEAGKAIIQGNTFGHGDVNIRVAKEVKSAIIMGNQAEDGLTVENNAGKKTQILANEDDPVEWTDQARQHYHINIGVDGDSRYLRDSHGPEPDQGKGDHIRARWSGSKSKLVLPVVPNTDYILSLDVRIPALAADKDAGVYFLDKRLAELKPGENPIQVKLRSGDETNVTVEIRCKGWIPMQTDPNSRDNRTLGIRLFGLTMKAKDAGQKVFNANTGQWE